MKREPFGGGRNKKIRLSRSLQPLEARMGLAGSPVGVIRAGACTGMVAHPYWGAASQPDYRLVRDLYAALRKVDHILGKYSEDGVLGEKESLQKALEISWEMYDVLLGLRNSTLDSLEPVIRRLAKAIIDAVGRRPLDQLKKDMRSSASSLLDVLDSRGRVNPTAKESQVVTLRRQLYGRLMTIQAIEPNVFRWRYSFLELIQEAERLFHEVAGYLDPLFQRLNDPKKASQLSELARERAIIRLRHYADELERLDIRPFLSPCWRMANELRKGAEYISAERYRAATTVLKQAFESLKLRGVRSDLEKFLSYLSKLMHRPDRQLSRRDRMRIINGINNIRRRLGQVNEYRFVHQVCLQAKQDLQDAASVFKAVMYGPVGGLKQFREKLKVVARPL